MKILALTKMHPWIFLILVLVVTGYVNCNDGPSVELPQGKVVGTHMKSYQGRTFSAFEGIPYAKPPTGKLRFAEPQSAEKWEGVLYANTTYVCMQYIPLPVFKGVKGKEDCLYVYVYIPKETIDGSENLDVIVNIHGGAFMFGAPKMMVGPDYIMDKDVVYVSLNYRLGLLGFFTTQDSVVPGNNGLKDQVLALKWIKENIKHFGGNPDSITIIGLSAGGASVHYHYLSPMSRGLFNRGFSQSGTALQPWSLIENPSQYNKKIADKLGCSVDSSKELVSCLRKKSGTTLVEALTATYVYGNLPFIPFAVVIEKDAANPFLSEHPYKTLKEGNVYDVPWITSNVKDEGVIPAGLFFFLNQIRELNKRWDELMPYVLDITDTVEESDMSDVLQKVREKYFPDKKMSNDNVYDLVKLLSDRLFFNDAEKAFRIHSKVAESPVRYYFFNYTLQQRFLIPMMEKGVAHGDDGRLAYNGLMSPSKLDNKDEQMMQFFIDFLADFAANKELKVNDVEWTPIDPESKEIDFLHINGPKDIFMDRWAEIVDRKFWDALPIKENDKLF